MQQQNHQNLHRAQHQQTKYDSGVEPNNTFNNIMNELKTDIPSVDLSDSSGKSIYSLKLMSPSFSSNNAVIPSVVTATSNKSNELAASEENSFDMMDKILNDNISKFNR